MLKTIHRNQHLLDDPQYSIVYTHDVARIPVEIPLSSSLVHSFHQTIRSEWAHLLQLWTHDAMRGGIMRDDLCDAAQYDTRYMTYTYEGLLQDHALLLTQEPLG